MWEYSNASVWLVQHLVTVPGVRYTVEAFPVAAHYYSDDVRRR